jgi:16S rRNA C1402 (ribose-2'-O) methylase RsmI
VRLEIEMLLYILICLSLSLAGVAGLQFTYLFYLDRLDKERKKRIHELELQCKSLSRRLHEAEARIDEQNDVLSSFYTDEEGEEAWADVIEDR